MNRDSRVSGRGEPGTPGGTRPSQAVHAAAADLHETAVQRAVHGAVQQAGIAKPASCHTFRHGFATHPRANGHDIRTVQELLGHRNVATTMLYTHVLNKGGLGVRSPLDGIRVPD